MRAQYHFRQSPNGLQAWDIRKLVQETGHLAVISVPLSDIAEVDENWWFNDKVPTVRAIADHITLIEDADLSFPILLCPEGRLMDGMHRVAKALALGYISIDARRLRTLPEPDYVGVAPDDLPYD